MTTVQEAIALLSKDSASKKLRNIFSHRTLGFTCPYSKLRNAEKAHRVAGSIPLFLTGVVGE
jgi:hypothetical protein